MSAVVDERSNAEVIAIGSCLDAWKGRPAVAYHLLNDGGVLMNGADGLESKYVEVIGGDIAENALHQIENRFKHLKDGHLETNTTSDEKFFKNKASLGVYAFSTSPLINSFMREGDPTATNSEVIGDE